MGTNRLGEVIRHLGGRELLHEGADLTDGQLLERFLSRRDDSAVAALVRRHGPMVWGVCRRILRGYHDAEDAFQATFLVLVRKAASIRPREMAANWLYGVARQTALKARAMAAKRRARARQVTQMPEPARVERDLRRDLEPLVDDELARLPHKYRAVVLCDLAGLTRAEAARQLGVPDGTVAGRLARARALLATRLARRGLGLSSAAVAAALSPKAASAGVPAAVASVTIKAASLSAAGHAAAGRLISAQVAALTEGVLRSMLLTKLKTATVILLLAGLLSTSAAGLVYAVAGEQQGGKPVGGTQPQLRAADLHQQVDNELREIRAELKQLRAEHEGLKKGLQRQAGRETAGEPKLVVKVYPVAGLTRPPNAEGEEARSLIRVVTNTVEPASWIASGGDGSIEYYPEGLSLVIRQSPEVQKQVHDLLETLRKTKAEQDKAHNQGPGQ
jgi:RNA polymerase sigma factor (sigma-70 family)